MIGSIVASELGIPIWLLVIVVIWNLIWKGLALWRSAQSKHTAWFIAFLVIQTMGILEILYLYLFSKIKLEPVEKKRKKH